MTNRRHWTRDLVAPMVDHTLLKPEATVVDIAFLVEEATDLGVYAVCVSPSMVPAVTRAGSLSVAIAEPTGGGRKTPTRPVPPRIANQIGLLSFSAAG